MIRIKKKLTWWVKLMRYFGRSLVIIWAAFWLFFVLASVVGEFSIAEGSWQGLLIGKGSD